jgi:hypothetical protein
LDRAARHPIRLEEVLDYIAEPLEWLLMHTIPKKVELTR